MERAKVLAIGLDAADRRLVEQWCDSGDLPVLRSMRERGAYGQLTGPPAMGDDAAWASFYTAVSPARHGRYFWQRLKRGSYETPKFRDEDLSQEPFWTDLSRAGRRVAVIDVPKCPLTKSLNGIQIADWLVHGRDHQSTCSWPPELAPALLARFGDDMTDRVDGEWLCRLHALPDDQCAVFRRRLLDGIAKKTEAVSEFLEQGGWDLFLVVFKEAHCAGHQCWHLLGNAAQNPIKDVYKALDAAIGKLAAMVGPQTHVIVFSDLGMGPNYTGEHLLDQVLLKLEKNFNTTNPWAREILRRMQVRLKIGTPARDPRANRLAYQVEHNEISGAIRINLAGREPNGRIRRGQEYKELCALLTGQLLSLRDPETGEQVVESVLSSDEMYPGDQRDCLPDLFVVWKRQAPITGAVSASISELKAGDPGYRTGNHLPGGFYIGAGPGTHPGAQREQASIMDIAPTIARLLEAPLPGKDGKPISALCRIA
jgi:predicted AlkP superfamily phosphohydrolase/phosphomutase